MSLASDMLDQTIDSIDRVRKILTRGKSKQVTTNDEKTALKTAAVAWFSSSRPTLAEIDSNPLLASVDAQFRQLLEGAEKSSARSKLRDITKELRRNLVSLRSDALAAGSSATSRSGSQGAPQALSTLVSDPAMQNILQNRWHETELCIKSGANLAAVVMTGALLEALFLARVNRLNDKSCLFKLSCTPKDRLGKPIPLGDWTLKHFIDASHELKWIRQAAREIGNILRDYRNFIHPEKELRQGITMNEQDVRMFWPILNSLAEQIVDSVKRGG